MPVHVTYLKDIFYSLIGNYSHNNSIDYLWNEIIIHYTGNKRHYHNLNHLENMYSELSTCKFLFDDFETIIFSLFYHDIVYNPSVKDNEEKSAALAVKRLSEINYPAHKINMCREAILATKSHIVSSSNDINLFTDADLSILGSNPEKYQEYYKQIRKEYSVYPDFLYNPGRKKVLIGFLNMDYIYKTQYFRDRYECAARTNIASEMKNL